MSWKKLFDQIDQLCKEVSEPNETSESSIDVIALNRRYDLMNFDEEATEDSDKEATEESDKEAVEDFDKEDMEDFDEEAMEDSDEEAMEDSDEEATEDSEEDDTDLSDEGESDAVRRTIRLKVPSRIGTLKRPMRTETYKMLNGHKKELVNMRKRLTKNHLRVLQYQKIHNRSIRMFNSQLKDFNKLVKIQNQLDRIKAKREDREKRRQVQVMKKKKKAIKF